jgi:hypothetical protein
MKFCVYTRSFFENPYLDFFIEHYCKLGFHKIVILKADTEVYHCPPEYASKVEIHQVPNKGNELLPMYNHLVLKSDSDWILSCDVDELLLLNKKYKNIESFVADKLKVSNNINAFYFRWGMVEKYDVEPKSSLPHLLKKYKVYKNMHIKSMVKRSALQIIHDPHVCRVNNLHVYFERKVLTNNSPLHALETHSYEDAMLLHVHTRSLNNIVLKALQTALVAKVVKDVSKFSDLIKCKAGDEKDKRSLDLFKEAIGKKATLPFTHCKEVAFTNEELKQFLIPESSREVINKVMETQDIIKALEKKNINRLEYLGFIARLNEKTKNLFTKTSS